MKTFLYFSNNNGSISFQASPDEKWLKTFEKTQLNVEKIEFVVDEKNIPHDLALKKIAKHLWSELGDIATDDVDDETVLSQPFQHFDEGDSIDDVWHWFEEEFDLSIADDLMYTSQPK